MNYEDDDNSEVVHSESLEIWHFRVRIWFNRMDFVHPYDETIVLSQMIIRYSIYYTIYTILVSGSSRSSQSQRLKKGAKADIYGFHWANMAMICKAVYM